MTLKALNVNIMNVFMSSTIDSNLFNNSKSSFTNRVPLLSNERKYVELRSLLFDNRISYIEKHDAPILIFHTPDIVQPSVDENVFNIKVIEVFTFNCDVVFTVSQINRSIVKNTEIILPSQEFLDISHFVKLVNKELLKSKCGVTVEVYNKNEQDTRIVFKKDTISEVKTRISLPGQLAYELGFLKKYTEKHLTIPLKSRIKGRYEMQQKPSFFTLVWLKECDVETVSDLLKLLRYIIENVGFLPSYPETFSDSIHFKLNVKQSGLLGVSFLNDFLKTITSVDPVFDRSETFDFLKQNSQYCSFHSEVNIEIKKFQKPKLIKVFCPQLSHTSALTSSSLGLLALLPFKNTSSYQYKSENPIVVPLYNSKIEKITIKITDENDVQLRLSTGVPSFINCRLTTNIFEMYTICHFNSGDRESKKYFPSNSSSYFTQNLAQPIDARIGEYHASLQSIFLPPALHNINSETTKFKIEYIEGGELLEDDLNIDTGFYTRTSFIDSLNKKLQSRQIHFELNNGILIMHNKSSSYIKLALNPQLSYFLGCTTGMDQNWIEINLAENTSKSLLFSYKFLSLVTRFIKVKANFITDSLLGNNLQAIFRIVNLDVENMKDDGQGVFVSFPSKHWIKIIPNIYNNITLSFSDENDIPLSYSSSKSVEGIFIVRKGLKDGIV